MKFVDKTRTGIPDAGSKLSRVVNSQAWGADAAVKRGYGKGVEHPMRTGPAEGAGPYLPQQKADKPADPTFNDVKAGWIRGMSPNQAEDRPGYRHSWRAPTKPGSDDYKVGYRDSDPLRQGGGGNAPRGKKHA